MRILGIETSCDETAAAVVENGKTVLSSTVFSQVEVHKKFGGVVPELASRHHLERIGPCIQAAMETAAVGFRDLDGIAVTNGPGLVGPLLVGVSTAKAISFAHHLPLLAVNHLEGHIESVWLEHGEIPLPGLALIVSGGHTSLYRTRGPGDYRILAETRDDAAGEAFDKVAKLLGFDYPGGPIIDRLARRGNPRAVPLPVARMSDGSLDFSFSGIKTAVLRYCQANSIKPQDDPDNPSQQVLDLLASFQSTVVENLIQRVRKAVRIERSASVLVSGGVACNSLLRERFRELARKDRFRFYCPSPDLSLDNAAMVAAVGARHLREGRIAGLDLNAEPNLRLGKKLDRQSRRKRP
ncbi:MAG: tRNA (adenosine(37)-N6)-threonylcarbamoyltransferase complex transferase subunit TsaD [Acidobacteria bacterium]|nr:tRNA (adenosine(37)-N6)-threonylcarbamoyltransferase complex transferase subunit TsaD [Acidobacteriota bacterium]